MKAEGRPPPVISNLKSQIAGSRPAPNAKSEYLPAEAHASGANASAGHAQNFNAPIEA